MKFPFSVTYRKCSPRSGIIRPYQIIWHILLIPLCFKNTSQCSGVAGQNIFNFNQYMLAPTIISPIWYDFCELYDLNSQTDI